MFEKFDESANDVLAAARRECIRLRSPQMLPEHILLALVSNPDNIAARALATMSLRLDNVREEVERALSSGIQPESTPPAVVPVPDGIAESEFRTAYSDAVLKVFERSNDFRLFFGRDKVSPEHILLGMVDLNDFGSLQILEELGANLTFLRRQAMNLIAKVDSVCSKSPQARPTVLKGISEIIAQHVESLDNLRRLVASTGVAVAKLPDRSDVVLMVFLAYLPDFLLTQIAYQRYLLEETLRLLNRRTGTLDKEVTATIVSQTAQHLRSEVRAIIDHLWSKEYRMLSQVLDEAEHEEIGSIIEDLWWTYSEEIALDDVFDEALNDYRRKQVLNLQKRKLEISARLNNIKRRLEDTLRQSFTRRSLSA